MDISLFWSKVEAAGVCWEWTGSIRDDGYGEYGHHHRLVHRIAYELLVGDIPASLVCDHLCRNRCCVNPDHIELVPLAENVRRGSRGQLAFRPFCGNGHPMVEGVSFVWRSNRRVCFQCKRDSYHRTKDLAVRNEKYAASRT